MHAQRMLRLFTAVSIMLFVSSAMVFAGGKQEKTPEKENESKQDVTEQAAPEQATPEQDKKSSENAQSEPVAVVNGEEISQQEFDQLLNYFRYQYMQQGMEVQGPQLEQLKQMVLESLIDNELMYQIAKENGYGPSEEELDEELQNTKDRFADEDAYQKALNQQGMNESELRQELSKQMTKYEFEQDKFGEQTQVDSAEVKDFYDDNPQQFEQPEQVRASHILIKVAEDATEEDKQAAEEKLLKAKERIENGEEFSEVARDVSEDPSSERGGDLDYFSRGQMVPAFEEAVFNMEVGELSGIVESSFGYHLIKKTDEKEASTVPFEEVEGDIKTHLERVKLQDAKKDFLEDKKQDAEIERFVESG
ncbi:MAG: peptidylprolyl isomerase [Spirochaetia bacterium]